MQDECIERSCDVAEVEEAPSGHSATRASDGLQLAVNRNNVVSATAQAVHRRKMMSRRIGQNGSVEVRNGVWRGRYLVDLPGCFQRVKRSVTLGPVGQMTKSEGRRRLREIILAEGINAPSYKIPSTLLYHQHVRQWEQSYLERLKPSTQRTMRHHLKKYLLPRWGRMPVDGITAHAVNEWLGDPALRRLSPHTVRGIVRTLQLSLRAKWGRGSIQYPSTLRPETETRCYSADEVVSLLSVAQGQYRVLFTLAAETGMRAGELYGLHVEDVDFQHHIIHVRRALWDGQEQTPKTRNSQRAVDVKPYVTEMLRQYLVGRTTGLMFRSQRGTPLRNSMVLHRHLYPLLRQLGLPRGGMHAFRHFRVSFLVESGAPLETIRRWIGHGSDDMLRRYLHLSSVHCRNVLEGIPAVGQIAPLPQPETETVVQ
jgi:integrase